MGLFNSAEKEERARFKAQLNAQQDANALGATQQLQDQAQAFYDPQVSSLILECERRYLPWKVNAEERTLYLPRKYDGLKEPISRDDIMSFLNDEEKKIVWEGYELLDEYFTIGEKYGFVPNVVRAFNKTVGSIEHIAHVSRMGGKNVKAAKSQFVETNSAFSRYNDKGGKQDKLFGLF